MSKRSKGKQATESISKKEKKQKASPAEGFLGIDPERCRHVDGEQRYPLSHKPLTFKAASKAVLLWMSRDQRVQDNWALLLARALAQEHSVELIVVFNLVPKFLEATLRQYDFMLRGLEEVEQELRKLNIAFHLLMGQPEQTIPSFVKAHKVGMLVCDMSPLRVPRQWVDQTAAIVSKEGIMTIQVDAHNVVPVWTASDKREYAARTIRSKIHNQLSRFMTAFPTVQAQPPGTGLPAPVDWKEAAKTLQIDRKVLPVDWLQPGGKAASATLQDFIQHKMSRFASKRNDPNQDVSSNLSPFFHFGQLAPQRALLEVTANRSRSNDGANSFIEEALVRRELSDNFCWYTPDYDQLSSAYDWAKESLELHSKDQREYLYSREELEAGVTHDDLWNAAQLQVVRTGKMHGFLRMYWAKKILEWTPTPAEALSTSIHLNDKYQLDGRDPNGYVGCGWSIMGIHDMGWKERTIFGKIRYMNYGGCKRKFDIPAFVKRFEGASPKSDKFKLAKAALKAIKK